MTITSAHRCTVLACPGWKYKMNAYFLLSICTLLFFSVTADYSVNDPLNLNKLTKVTTLSDDYVKGSIWPKPKGQSQTGVKFSLSPKTFTFQINGKTSDVLTQAVQRYKILTFPDDDVTKKAQGLDVLESLEVVVVDDYRNMTIESDESCKFYFSQWKTHFVTTIN